MKKIILTMVAAMAFTFSFAETNSFNVENHAGFEKAIVSDAGTRFDMSCNMRRLSALLDLNDWQMEAVEVIHKNFNDRLQELSSVRGPKLRHKVHQAVRKDAEQMRSVLNDKQFDTYMSLLITTLHNKHL